MFATIYLPDFHLQTALRLREEQGQKPIAVVGGSDEKVLILEYNSVAKENGIVSGMTTPQALGRCPGLLLFPCDQKQERNVQAILLEVAHSLSPHVEATAENICTVDLRQTKMPPAWGEKMIQRFAGLKLKVQLGIAPNPGLALLAAHRANPILTVRVPEDFLQHLPLSAVQPSAELQQILAGWGIHTLGQFTRIPHDELTSRLGSEASQLWQRAAGKIQRPLRLVRPVEEFSECLDFEHEIETLEPLLFILRRFLDQLTKRLEGAYRVVARMILTLPLENNSFHERSFTIPSPTLDAEVLYRILDTHLEGLQLEQRPTGIRLQMEPVRPEHSQQRLFENALRDPNRFGETVARLIALVGEGHVGTASLKNTHHPDAFQIVEPEFHKLTDTLETETPLVGLPLRRYRPALSAQVQTQQHSPVHVVSEVIHGRVMDALGPYRIGSDWWDTNEWKCEEWDVEIADGLYRLSRDHSGWKVEGCYEAILR